MSTLIAEVKINSSDYHFWKTHISFIFYFKHISYYWANSLYYPR